MYRYSVWLLNLFLLSLPTGLLAAQDAHLVIIGDVQGDFPGTLPSSSEQEESATTLNIDLQASRSDQQEVVLRWTNPDKDIEYLTIERSEYGGDFTPIALLYPHDMYAQETQFNDYAVADQATYQYRIAFTQASNAQPALEPNTASMNLAPESSNLRSETVTLRWYPGCTTTRSGFGEDNNDIATSRVKLHTLEVSGLNIEVNSFSGLIRETDGSTPSDLLIRLKLGYITMVTMNSSSNTGSTGTALVARDALINRSGMNFFRLMMALDGDNNNSNGIQLPCALYSVQGGIQLDVDYQEFAQQVTVAEITGYNRLPSDQDVLQLFMQLSSNGDTQTRDGQQIYATDTTKGTSFAWGG